MSIVVAMTFPNEGVVMCADRRSVTTIGSSVETSNNFSKIHQISEAVLCGITGSAQWGMLVINRLVAAKLNNPSDMIDLVKSHSYQSANGILDSTVTLCGIYDNGRPFLWTYRSSGDSTFEQEGINHSVATDPESLMEACSKYLVEQYHETKSVRQTLHNVIRFAAEKNPDHISQEYDIAFLKL